MRFIFVPVVVAGALIACWSSASCMRTVVRGLECKYDAEAAAAASKGEVGGHRGTVRSLHFTADGTRIVSSGLGGRVLLWDLKTGASRAVLPEREGSVAIAFGENQQALALDPGDGDELELFDVRRGEARGSIPGAVGPGLRPFAGHAFSRDGALIAVAGEGDGITLWNIKVGQAEVELAGPGARVNDLCFSPDDELLAVAVADGSVSFWSTESGEQTDSIEPHGGAPIAAIDFSADGERIVAASADGEVVVTGVSASGPGRVLEECDVAGKTVRALRFSPSGKAVFGVKRDGCAVQFVCVWDVESGKAVAAFEVPVSDAIDFNADGSMMATGGCGCEIILWDLEVGIPSEQLGASCRLEVERGCDD
jgi:WD40 repeat protein